MGCSAVCHRWDLQRSAWGSLHQWAPKFKEQLNVS